MNNIGTEAEIFLALHKKGSETRVKKFQRVRKVWKPPDKDCYKTNFDGALFEEGEVGIGVVARNHRGKVMASLSLWKNTNSSSVVTLEMLAARRAILYAQELGIG